MDSDTSIYPTGRWKAWLEHPVDSGVTTSGLVGAIGWEGPWGSVFRKAAQSSGWGATVEGWHIGYGEACDHGHPRLIRGHPEGDSSVYC